MLVETLAMVMSIANAVSAILVSKGLEESNPISSVLISNLVQTLCLMVLFIVNTPDLNWTAITFFAVSGIFAFGLARLLYFMSIEQLGVSISSAIIGINPLLSTLLAAILLGENIVPSALTGAILVVTGIYLLSGTKGRSIIRRSIIIPILSTTSYAISTVLRKGGLNIQPDPIFGAQIVAISGTLSFLTYLAISGKLSEIRVSKRSIIYFSTSGLVLGIGWIAFMTALEMGNVSVVTTIVFSYPLFSLILSWFFLKGQEDLSLRVVTGCIVIVIGVILVTLL
jgi:uncharacterized membrane protein